MAINTSSAELGEHANFHTNGRDPRSNLKATKLPFGTRLEKILPVAIFRIRLPTTGSSFDAKNGGFHRPQSSLHIQYAFSISLIHL
jgi:hypothetical protein